MAADNSGFPQSTTITLSDVLADCDAIETARLRYGSISLPADTQIDKLDVYTTHDGDNWGKFSNASGTVYQITIPNDASNRVFCEIPDAVTQKCPVFKLLVSSTGTGTAPEEATVFLKD